DSIQHEDGSIAAGPIAVVEAQGYAYAARRAFGALLRARGENARADEVDGGAERVRQEIEARFFVEELGTYAIALDGHQRPCRVVTSNAGHLLFTRAISPERGRRLAARLFADDLFCGFGIRTLSSSAARYNPMSYHNGSVWPHDNALIALGLRRYGDPE